MISKIGIIANIEKPNAPEYTIRLQKWIQSMGLEALLESALAARIGQAPGYDRDELASKVRPGSRIRRGRHPLDGRQVHVPA